MNEKLLVNVNTSEEIQRLKIEVEALKQLLEVQEQSVIEQSVKLEQSLNELRLMKFSVDQSSIAAFMALPNAKFIYANNEACRLLDYSPEEILSLYLYNIDKQISKETWEKERKRLKHQGFFTVESYYHARDGRTFPVEVVMNYLEFNKNNYIYIFAHDITKKRALEKALMKDKEQMERAQEQLVNAYTELKNTQSKILQQEKMASIGQLAAGVAHEINNPMGFISSNLGTLDKYINRFTEFIHVQSQVITALDPSPEVEELKEIRKKLKLDYVIEDAKDLIKESLDGTDRVKKIVQNLKSFSRVDEAEYKYADINECIESTLNIVWNELKYKATVEKEYGEMPLTKCYPQQLNQVFMNLLVNAAQAIEKQGVINIKTWNRDGTINISISDTGKGLPEDKINKVFDPFFTTKDVGKGTGLGLSISYDIVKKHNGNITVNSEVGKGTTFTVKIPVSEE